MERYSVQEGDLLVCEGGEPGRAAIWDSDCRMMYQKALHRVRPRFGIAPKWMLYHIWHDAEMGILEQYFTGSTIKHFTGKALAKYPVRIPPLAEQSEIVRSVEALFALADAIDRRVDMAAGRAESIVQSVLAKAFRGDLELSSANEHA